MRRTRAVLTLILLVLAALGVVGVGAAGPAVAGGPTSVLLSAPGEGRVAALYYTDADYDALAQLVEEAGGERHGGHDRLPRPSRQGHPDQLSRRLAKKPRRSAAASSAPIPSTTSGAWCAWG